MRLFAKFFLCATVVISAALLLSGYLMIAFSYESAINRETERAVKQFQFDKFTVQASLLSNAVNSDDLITYNLLSRLSSEINGLTVFFAEDGQPLYSDLSSNDTAQPGFSLPSQITDNIHVMQMQTVDGVSYITVSGKITQNGVTLYLLVAADINGVIAQKEQMTRSFAGIYFITLLLGMAVILILSVFITRPIKKLDRAASQIARGRYNERLPISSGDEIGDLSHSFNLMADAVEDKIRELLDNARQKEDFVASFAHELKTPLTSIIGYADMLYQKTPPAEQAKDAAWYILNEGLRLEALSLKLMDLIILRRQDFVLEEMAADELFSDIAGGLKPVLEEKGVKLYLNIEPGYIWVEYDLFKTLALNLIDNAVKAGCGRLTITGRQTDNKYSVSVADDGSGMPPSELARITEAFYTVDKSRSRRQHGAGLGLALAEAIAEIHGGSLAFDSAVGKGTTVTIDLIYERGGGVE